jgi:anti-sigma factor (TIGR02949 family)
MTPLTRYTCEEAFRRIDDFLDRELSAIEMQLVHEHLEICEGCAREFQFEASLLDGVKRKMRRIDVPAGLISRVLAALDGDGTHE